MSRIVCLYLLMVACSNAAAAEPGQARPPRSDDEWRSWLQNMVWHHKYSHEEIAEVTGIAPSAVPAALAKYSIHADNKPHRPANSPLLTLPYPGGRHPRIGFRDGAVDPQRETKISVLPPWDDGGYVVIDVPEAVWSNLGLTYLAHTHVPTLWTKQGVTLPRLEWIRRPNGSLGVERTLPNGITFGVEITPTRSSVHMNMWLRNGTKDKLTDLRVQMCAMLQHLAGFSKQTNDNKVLASPYAACRSDDGKRWVIMGWQPCHRAWGNPPCPCVHSDPKFPDCEPRETQRIHGRVWFYEGDNIRAEFARLDKTGWQTGALPRVSVSADRSGFVAEGESFRPWGFNYDHDETGRLIEDYWGKEWNKVAEDFAEMRDLGANVVRIHLQFGKFMKDRTTPDESALARLARLLELAEQNRLYLDLTGLGCYHKADVPPWYDELSEEDRWAAQAIFWEAVARTCSRSTAVFCYDLMNEPVSPAGKRKPGEWLGPAFGGKHFVQMISLDQAARPRHDIANAWIGTLTRAIRKHDAQGLITVGLVDWSLNRPGLTSGFVPERIADRLDFLCVHVYPEKGKVAGALKTVEAFRAAGKPVVIEETFPLKAGREEFQQFVAGSRSHAAGHIGFYWGKTIAECRRSGTIADAILADWLEYFRDQAETIRR